MDYLIEYEHHIANYQIKQIIKELETISQKQIDMNPRYFQTLQFIDRLVSRLQDTI